MRILNYHSILSDEERNPALCLGQIHASAFFRQMKYLKRFAVVYPLSEMVEKMNAGKSLSRRGVAITFDDGFRNNAELVHPILEDLQLPATYFISDAHIDQNRPLWFSRLTLELIRKNCLNLKQASKSWGELNQELGQGEPSEDVFRKLSEFLPEHERCDEIDRYLLGMSSKQLKEMARSPRVEIGGHCSTHPRLPKCSLGKIDFEIQENKKKLEAWTQRPVRYFAYPEGLYNLDVIHSAQRAGYEAGFAVQRIEGLGIPLFEISRIGIYRNSLAYLVFKLMFSRHGP